jgi:catechol 2,3-dioxygenase-like lactoylglutathione lyase family enzyme
MKETAPRNAGVRSQPLIAVRDVRASSRWYQHLLGTSALPEHEHRDTYNGMLCDGHLILQLHAWDEEHHPNLVNADAAPCGHGVLLWFEEPHVNPNAGHREIWLRDPDGYVVVIAGQ